MYEYIYLLFVAAGRLSQVSNLFFCQPEWKHFSDETSQKSPLGVSKWIRDVSFWLNEINFLKEIFTLRRTETIETSRPKNFVHSGID